MNYGMLLYQAEVLELRLIDAIYVESRKPLRICDFKREGRLADLVIRNRQRIVRRYLAKQRLI